MEYTPDLEKRVQQGKDDTNPQHDVIKLRINKADPKDRRYLYFVPNGDGNYEFCSNDGFIQAMISDRNKYKRQVVPRGAIFKVLDRVKSDLGMTSNQAQSTTQTSKTEAQVPFSQSRLAKAIKGLRNLDLKTLNELCLRHKYTLDWLDATTHTKPHSNPTFDGGLYLYDTLSGKGYAFTSDLCDSKKAVQRNICDKLFDAVLSNSNTAGEPTKEQQEDMVRRQSAEKQRKQQETEIIIAEQNRFRANQSIFETKKQKLIADLQARKIDVDAFKSFKESFDIMHKYSNSTQFYTILDEIMEKHPEVAESMTKTFVATYGFSLKGGREERGEWNSESENFFLKHHDCIKYVQKEFDAFVEPYKEKIARWKALDELAPALSYYLDINDGAETDKARYHTLNEEDIKSANRSPWKEVNYSIGDDFSPVSREQGRNMWAKLDVIRDENGEKIDEKANYEINKKIAQVYGVDLYQESTPTIEQRQYAQGLVDNYKEIKRQEEEKRAAQERIKAIKAEKQLSFMSENSVSAETSKEDMIQMINKMEVVPSRDNADQIGFNRKYIFRNEKGKEYELNIIDNQDKTLSVEFGPFSFSAKLTSVKEDYNPNDGALNRVFEHELKQATNEASRTDAIIINAALRKAGILGYPNTIKKKIKEGQVNPVQFTQTER